MDNKTDVIEVDELKTKMDAFIENLYLGMPVQDAAKQAGYSESYRISSLYQTMQGKGFRTKMRDYAITHDLMDLPLIYQLETKALKVALKKGVDDPESLINILPKFKDTIKSKKLIAGILKPDTQEVKHQTVNIGQIQAILRADLDTKLVSD